LKLNAQRKSLPWEPVANSEMYSSTAGERTPAGLQVCLRRPRIGYSLRFYFWWFIAACFKVFIVFFTYTSTVVVQMKTAEVEESEKVWNFIFKLKVLFWWDILWQLAPLVMSTILWKPWIKKFSFRFWHFHSNHPRLINMYEIILGTESVISESMRNAVLCGAPSVPFFFYDTDKYSAVGFELLAC
jgi:hypothetical protein